MLIYVSTGLLILRLVVGLLFAGHGAQKLFGWFGGKGIAGQTALLEKIDVQPARLWAWISALGEFLGGLGLALGLLTPLAATILVGSMLVVIFKVSWQNGLWNSNRGIEWPLVLATVAFVIGLTGPGPYSLDYSLGLPIPELLTYVIALALMLITVLGVVLPGRTSQEHRHQPE